MFRALVGLKVAELLAAPKTPLSLALALFTDLEVLADLRFLGIVCKSNLMGGLAA